MKKKVMQEAVIQAVKKLNPKEQVRNPVMFLVYLCSIFITVLFGISCFYVIGESKLFLAILTIFLWFTVLFANFAESLAESRGRAGAEYLKKSKKEIIAKVLEKPSINASFIEKSSTELKKGDIVIVKAGEQIPLDGEVIEGVASVDESVITGESAPVIREAGGDRNSVTGGTTLLSDWLIVRITVEAGESFLDKMIEMIEGSKRQKTPNEIALEVLLLALTGIFIVVTASLYIFQKFSMEINQIEGRVSIAYLIALLVCLAPTTIGALLSSIGIAGMNRLNEKNVLATSGRAVEAAGDVDVLLLDKTGTITLGNRKAEQLIPVKGVEEKDLAIAASLASISDETPEGRSIVILAKEKFGIKPKDMEEKEAKFIPFTAATKMSGIDTKTEKIRKGAFSSIQKFVSQRGVDFPIELEEMIQKVAGEGATPLVVASDKKVYGVVVLKDIVKENIKEKFAELRNMGIRTVMITGDNEMTAKAISFEAGVDDYLAEATPEAKLKLIRKYQEDGHLVAMTGDGTNDAPALAAADVAVVMNSGTAAAKEAGNMIDLDSTPTKLMEIVKVGKKLLMTRGALTTFSIANDIAKYFAIIPSLLIGIYPGLSKLNIMRLSSPNSSILSAIIFNCLIIILLIPIAIKGVKYKEVSSEKLLKRNLLIYGVGGLIIPFIGIKIIDLIIGRWLI